LCTGSNAFPLVGAACGQAVQRYRRQQVRAGARRRGGDPSFYTEGVAKADTAVFIRNAVRWLGAGQTDVAVYRDKAVACALAASRA
jgi:hypothetical protein